MQHNDYYESIQKGVEVITKVCYPIAMGDYQRNSKIAFVNNYVEFCQHKHSNINDYEGQQNNGKEGDFCMPEQWTAEIIASMHMHHITAKQLSAQLGYHPKYVSAILNSHVRPKKAEQTFREALDELIRQKQAG